MPIAAPGAHDLPMHPPTDDGVADAPDVITVKSLQDKTKGSKAVLKDQSVWFVQDCRVKEHWPDVYCSSAGSHHHLAKNCWESGATKRVICGHCLNALDKL